MTNFKNCNVCCVTWKDRDSFLSDPDLEIIGYEINFLYVFDGLFLFNHLCGTTLSVKVSIFEDLYDGPKYKKILTKSKKCPDHCLDQNELSPCSEECKYAYTREIIQVIKNRRKEIK